jgi:peptidoglycan/xylan/chitin deacetylase (PgdA/CDA1 family)
VVLQESGIAIGAHGASHVPMTLSQDRRGELDGARRRLRDYLQSSDADGNVAALSFPHGRFDDTIIRLARDSGYAVMFTSAPHLNELTDGHLSSDICGRIEIATRHVAPEGAFRPDLLACHLFIRDSIKTPAEAITAGATIQ